MKTVASTAIALQAWERVRLVLLTLTEHSAVVEDVYPAELTTTARVQCKTARAVVQTDIEHQACLFVHLVRLIVIELQVCLNASHVL